MTKTIASSVADAALDHILKRASRITLCAGAPLSISDTTTTIGSGGKMLAELSLNPVAAAGFAISTTSESARKLTIGGQTEVLGMDAGTADHLAIIDTAGRKVLLVTELTEPQSILNGQVIAMRSFSVTVQNP